MDQNKDDGVCVIYGCYLAKGDGQVTVMIDSTPIDLELCDRHFSFFQTTDPEHYSIGTTFRNEVEVRPIAAQPAPVAPEE